MNNTEMFPASDWLLNQFTQFEKSLNGGAKLAFHAKRKQAFESYNKIGFPTSAKEEWKYTNPAPIQEKLFPILQSHSEATFSGEKFATPGLQSIQVEILNSSIKFVSERPSGLTICTLREVQKKGGELLSLVDKHLASNAQTDEAFVAINTALVDDAVIIHLDKNTVLTTPIELIFAKDSSVANKTLLPRVLFIAEMNSEAALIERYSSTSDFEYTSNSVVEFSVGENSHINHYRVQCESLKAFHISTIAATLEANAHFGTYTFSFGGKLVRNHVNVTLVGANCNVVMNGLTAINGDQHVDNATVLDNQKPNCESNELYKGVYNDRSQGVFSGSIIVRQAAQKTNAIQSNKSLLLSNEAGVNTKPQLKIWADDVKCTHGATIGQLDEQAMFYIRSRGASKQEARVMLIHAFASEVISGVKLEPLKANLEELLLEKLGF